MRLPVINGLIRRRLLVNFRVDEDLMRSFLPAPFRPKLHRGYAIAGICLIRLERIRPIGLPSFCGISSENAAHRIAVLWDEPSGGAREDSTVGQSEWDRKSIRFWKWFAWIMTSILVGVPVAAWLAWKLLTN
jgi:hypothetical protein